MIQKVRTLVVAAVVAGGLAVAVVPGAPVFAALCESGTSAVECITSGKNSVASEKDKEVKLEDQIKTITNVLLFLIGAIAVIMIIIGGIRYVTSNGDANQTKAAKDTIMYAVIGLVVAILAYAIVNFVITAFVKK
ncbi:MAG: pilin [Candidatus Saccharimonadales bacterium]